MASIFICGDVLNTKSCQGFIESNLVNKIKCCSYAIANLEAPVLRDKIIKDRKSGVNLCQKPETISILADSGFDMLLLANNHIMDYGEQGLKTTIESCYKKNVETLGAGISFEEAYKSKIINIEGKQIGLINACEAQHGVLDYYADKSTPGYAWINHRRIDLEVVRLKKHCDFVIVLVHAGLENFTTPLKQWQERYKQLCDLGADAIVCSHPHVPQGVEKYQDSYIFYSLGNFYFDWGENKSNISHSVILNFCDKLSFSLVCHETTNDGKVKELDINVEQYIEGLNDKLQDYKFENDSGFFDKLLPSIKKNLVKNISVIPTDGTVRGTVKTLLNYTGLNAKDKAINAHHFIRNESYQFALNQAYSIENE